jgi:hypothetical protein
MTLLRFLRERVTRDIWIDLVEVPLICGFRVAYFAADRAWRFYVRVTR